MPCPWQYLCQGMFFEVVWPRVPHNFVIFSLYFSNSNRKYLKLTKFDFQTNSSILHTPIHGTYWWRPIRRTVCIQLHQPASGNMFGKGGFHSFLHFIIRSAWSWSQQRDSHVTMVIRRHLQSNKANKSCSIILFYGHWSLLIVNVSQINWLSCQIFGISKQALDFCHFLTTPLLENSLVQEVLRLEIPSNSWWFSW